MKSLSTLTEILTRGEIYAISPSIIKKNVYICIFKDGSQCNLDTETYLKLVEE